MSSVSRFLLSLALYFAGPVIVLAARIGDLQETNVTDQILRFLSFKDQSVVIVVLGALALGVCCGLMGSFIVVRKMALVGDMLSHAVLPGIAAGFLWNQTKDPWAMVVGATVSGVLGILIVNAVRKTTHIKEDSALGMVLAGFYAIGVCMISMIQRLDTAEKSGLNHFMFGQAAALSETDVSMIAGIALVALFFVIILFKELLTTSFDAGFSRAIGIPYAFIEYALYLLLTFAIVVSLKAVGVVLVSALLIIPPATAYLLTDNFAKMLSISVIVGMVSALLGSFLSFLGNDLPTGPFMVVSAASIFSIAFLFGPRYGWIPRYFKRLQRTQRIRDENLLRSIYLIRERSAFQHPHITLTELADHRNENILEQSAGVQSLIKNRLAFFDPTESHSARVIPGERQLLLTAEGALRSCQLVRNHRLWELYLTHVANYATDHVHDDADRIEHLLGEDTVRELEKRLNHPQRDPHGKLIPSMADMQQLYASQGIAEGSNFRQDF
ncbi:MAG: iron chelate uptake ABC transporter family permease subunit [Verrucomicrobiota bacterium]